MNKLFVYTALAALMVGGIQGCASEGGSGPTAVISPATPVVVQPQWHTLEGQVVRKDGDTYVIQEPSGRQTRVFLDKKSASDAVMAGDPVVVRYDESTGYAMSLRRTAGPLVAPAVPAVVVPVVPVPRPQVIEGTVQRLEGNDYVIKDLSGSEVRLHVDPNTRLDRTIIAGDRIIAVTNSTAAVSNMYILGSPGVIQGEVVRIDGSSYVLRDITGREVRLDTNATTVRNGNIMVGDRVVAYLGPSSATYAESITRR